MNFKIKCKPQVYYYLNHFYGPSITARMTGDPVESSLFLAVFSLNKLKRYSYIDDYQPTDSIYKCEYQVVIRNPDVFSYGIREISNAATVKFNEMVMNFFRYHFNEQMLIFRHRYGLKHKQCIEHIMQCMQIDEHILPFDTLKKDYYRFRTTRQEFSKKPSIAFVTKINTDCGRVQKSICAHENDLALIHTEAKKRGFSFSQTIVAHAVNSIKHAELQPQQIDPAK